MAHGALTSGRAAYGAGAQVREGVPRYLLVCATSLEMEAVLRHVPLVQAAGADAKTAAPQEKFPGAPLGMTDAPGILSVADGARVYCEIAPLVCGVGPVAAALSLARELALAAVPEQTAPLYSGVINMGFAGSYDLALAPVGEAYMLSEECLPEYGVWPEYDEAVSPEDAPGAPQPLRFCQGLTPHGSVYTRLALHPCKALGNMGLSWHNDGLRAKGVTVAAVSGTPRRAKRLAGVAGVVLCSEAGPESGRICGTGCDAALAASAVAAGRTFDEALLESMEGFSLALGAAAYALPFLEIRAVSNEAGRRPPQTWNIPKASEALSRAAHRLFTPQERSDD